jgi:hypothetical protein
MNGHWQILCDVSSRRSETAAALGVTEIHHAAGEFGRRENAADEELREHIL